VRIAKQKRPSKGAAKVASSNGRRYGRLTTAVLNGQWRQPPIRHPGYAPTIHNGHGGEPADNLRTRSSGCAPAAGTFLIGDGTTCAHRRQGCIGRKCRESDHLADFLAGLCLTAQ